MSRTKPGDSLPFPKFQLPMLKNEQRAIANSVGKAAYPGNRELAEHLKCEVSKEATHLLENLQPQRSFRNEDGFMTCAVIGNRELQDPPSRQGLETALGHGCFSCHLRALQVLPQRDLTELLLLLLFLRLPFAQHVKSQLCLCTPWLRARVCFPAQSALSGEQCLYSRPLRLYSITCHAAHNTILLQKLNSELCRDWPTPHTCSSLHPLQVRDWNKILFPPTLTLSSGSLHPSAHDCHCSKSWSATQRKYSS